jgi:hypothetical protein
MLQWQEMERSSAFDTAKRDIARRIRRVCEHFAQDEFAALVERMARIDVKYRLRNDWASTSTATNQLLRGLN